jgi:hypothetical protein
LGLDDAEVVKKHMRALLLPLSLGMAIVAMGCGGSPKPKDPSATPAADDAPKWDSSSTTNQPQDKTPTTGPVVATPVPATGRSGEVYDKEETEIVLKRAARQVNANCGAATNEDGKATGPWGKGTVTIVLGHNGHSKSATMAPPFDGKPPGKCTVQAFSNMTFPPWGGADMTLDWEVDIAQPGSRK